MRSVPAGEGTHDVQGGEVDAAERAGRVLPCGRAGQRHQGQRLHAGDWQLLP